jgi:hypothetical protein
MQHRSISRVYFYITLVMLLPVYACKKEKPQNIPEPAMEYFTFNDNEIKAGAPAFFVDLNNDGRNDISFFTLLVGDALNQVDKLQFIVQSNIKVNLPVKPGEEIPLMKQGDLIPLTDFDSYQWFELSSIMLFQKITSFTQPPVWEGHWKDAVRKYIPYQLLDADKIYCGWLEVSADIPNERLLLHKAAISKEPNKIIKAGI